MAAVSLVLVTAPVTLLAENKKAGWEDAGGPIVVV